MNTPKNVRLHSLVETDYIHLVQHYFPISPPNTLPLFCVLNPSVPIGTSETYHTNLRTSTWRVKPDTVENNNGGYVTLRGTRNTEKKNTILRTTCR